MKSARPSAPLGIAAVAAVVLAMVALGRSDVVLGSAAGQLLWFLVMFVVIIPAHELGHALVGALVGYRIRAIVIGAGPALLQGQLAGVTIRVALLPFGGVTMGTATGTSWPRLRMWLFSAGGPAANLLLCFLLKRHTGHGAFLGENEHGVAAMAAAASWGVLFLNLLPFRTAEGRMSDGYSLFTVPFWSAERVLRARVVAGGAPVLLALQQGDLVTAETALSALRARHGDHPVVQGYTGMLHHRALRHDEARAAWRASLAADTDTFGRLLMKNNIAWADFLLDDRESATEADACSADALAARGDLAAFMGTRGAVLDWIGRSAEALPLLERAVASQADARGQASNHACLAMALAHLGRRTEAAAHLASARALDPACELLARAEVATVAVDPGAPDALPVAPVASIWDRWGGLLRWRQAARALATITLLIPGRAFDLGLLACLMAVLLDPEPAGLGAMGAMQIVLGLEWALDPPSAADSVHALTVAWMVAAGLAVIALALIRDRLGPRAPSRTAKVLGWVLGVPCGFQLLVALRLRSQDGTDLLHSVRGSIPLFFALAAVLLASRRRAGRIAALLPAALALLAIPAVLDTARANRRVAAIPADGPPIAWAEPRAAQVLRQRDVPGRLGTVTLSPSGQSLLVEDDVTQRSDEWPRFRVGGFTGSLGETRALAGTLPDDDRVAVLVRAGRVQDGVQLAMLPRTDLRRPSWTKDLSTLMYFDASLMLDPARRAILVLARSFEQKRWVAVRVPLTGSGDIETLSVAPLGDEATFAAWTLTPDGQVGRASVTEANATVLPSAAGRPDVWFLMPGLERGTFLRLDPLTHVLRRVPGAEMTFTVPVRFAAEKAAFALGDRIGVVDVAARRGTWLTVPARAYSIAAGGLAAISYHRRTNTSTVMVLAEP